MHLFELLFALGKLLILFWPVFLACFLYIWWHYRKFKRSTYSNATGNGFLRTIYDKGLYGEYLTFQILEKCPGYKRLLANVYVPKEDGSTTEVDVVMLSEAGVFVFESKNYSGWIYGDEKSKMWTQVLNKRTKNKLYNPIWQNRGHISAMQKVLGRLSIDSSVYRSYIVFSERCQLKNIEVTALDVWLLKRNTLKKVLYKDVRDNLGALSSDMVDQMYHLLLHYAHADETTKQAHVVKIEEKKVSRQSSSVFQNNSTVPKTKKEPLVVPVSPVEAGAIEVAAATTGDLCPLCGAAVALFQGRRGAYYGCQVCSYRRN